MNKIKYTFLLVACVFGISAIQAQERLSMTTSLAAGKTFTFTINYGVEIDVDWGDGTSVKYTSLGDPISGTLKGQVVSVTGYDITLLECAGQSITSLNVSGLPGLGTLLCQNNQLTTLSISQNKKLRKLNAANNQLALLSFGTLNGIQELVVSNNLLSSLAVSLHREMKTLICNDNKIMLLSLSNLSKLETLWCQNNQLSSLNLAANTNLETLMCQNNKIQTLNITGLASLSDVWCDANRISSLDLSSNAALSYLSADNGILETLNYGSAGNLKALYLNGNKLGYAGLLSTQKVLNYGYSPQDSLRIASNLDTNTDLDLSAQLKTADNVATNATFKWFDQGKLLSVNADYTENNGIFRFTHSVSKLHGEITSTLFPDLPKIVTSSAIVLAGTGVGKTTADLSLQISTSRGKLVINSLVEQSVNIYSITGALVRSFANLHGLVELELPRGTYIVNRTKVIL